MKCLILLLLTLSASGQLRIQSAPFRIPAADLQKLLQAVIDVFPEEKLPPLFISRHERGPLTLYERTPRGEIAIELDTGGRYYCQYIYQFAHELTHVRSKFSKPSHQNKWLEEVLCEVASLFALQKLADQWEARPILPSQTEYHESIQTYFENVRGSYQNLNPEDLPAFYQKHQERLRASATERQLNGAIARALLPLFQKNPDNWLALRTLPKNPGLSLHDYLQLWHTQAEKKHHPFLLRLQETLLSK